MGQTAGMPPAAAGMAQRAMMPGTGGKGGMPPAPSYGNMMMQASGAQPPAADQMAMQRNRAQAQMPAQDWMRSPSQQVAAQMPAAAQQQMAAMLGSQPAQPMPQPAAPAQPMPKPRAQGKPLRMKPY